MIPHVPLMQTSIRPMLSVYVLAGTNRNASSEHSTTKIIILNSSMKRLHYIKHFPNKLLDGVTEQTTHTVNRLFFVIEKFLSLRLLTKIFHQKIFLTLNFSLRKNFKTKY